MLQIFRARKVWIPEGDKIGQEVFEAANVKPIASPVANVYTGLQTGLLDTVTINPTGAIALQWHTKVSNLSDLPLLLIMGTMVVDQKVFRKLKPEDQVIVKEAIAAAFKRLDKLNAEGDIKAREALQKNGVTFNKPTAEEEVVWKETAEKALVKLKAENAYPAELYEQLQQSLEAYRAGQ